MLGIKVSKEKAEQTKRTLIKLGLLDPAKEVKREGNFVIFPTKKLEKLPLQAGAEVVETGFEERETSKKFEDYLKEFLCEEEMKDVRHSFDLVGSVAIIEIPEELERHEQKIAESLMLAQKNIKTVLKKSSEIRGTERVRELKFLSGENKTKTLYKEHGCRFKLDVAKVYFSPRLSYERQRILEQVKDGEVIADLFAGVGPFSILLAKYRDVKVYAIDVNPAAVEYLKENIKLNKVEDGVVPLLGNARDAAPRKTASRVIMNLPKSSDKYLDVAFDVLKQGAIHFYAISPEDDLYDSKIKFIESVAKQKGRAIEILNKRIVRPYSPRNYHVVIDVVVE